MIDVEYIPESDLLALTTGRHEHDFPGQFRDYCESRGLDPESLLLENEVDYSPEMERAVKARKALRKFLEK